MRNYKYLFNVFKAILEQSLVIQGRFYVGHRYGLQDINYDELAEILTANPVGKEYPLVMVTPPHSFLYLHGNKQDRERFRFVMYFAAKSMSKDIDPRRAISNYDIPDDWQDMKDAALNFLRTLDAYSRSLSPIPFALINDQTFTAPFSEVGADKLSGVKLDFSLVLGLDCKDEENTEYPLDLNYLALMKKLDKEYVAMNAYVTGENEFVVNQTTVFLREFLDVNIRLFRNNILLRPHEWSWNKATAELTLSTPIEETEYFTVQPY